MRISVPLTLFGVLPSAYSFAPSSIPSFKACRTRGSGNLVLGGSQSSPKSLGATVEGQHQDDTNSNFMEELLIKQGIVVSDKLSFRSPLAEERGKGGVIAVDSIAALDVLARVPRSQIIATCDSPPEALEASAKATFFSWAADLTAATLVTLHPNNNDDNEKQNWVKSWVSGGWATDAADLGPPDVDWGSKCCTGSLLSTGSDNDKEVYAKFRFPCHPVVYRAGSGLALLTGAEEKDCLDALALRGKTYRSMRYALSPLVPQPSDIYENKGSINERRCWDVADTLSRVLSRVTSIHLNNGDEEEVSTFAVVPIHERLANCNDQGENSKLVASGNDEILLIATRDIEKGEQITRDYATAPKLDGDLSEGSLRLLLQFGLPPNAW